MPPLRDRLVVNGELGPHYISGFDAMTVSACNGTAEITGRPTNRRTQQGLLERIAGLGSSGAPLSPFEPEKGELKAQPDYGHAPPTAVGAGLPQSNN